MPNRTSLLIPFCLLSLLVATPAAAQYTHRLTRIVYDFDANSTPDADTNVGYNAAGEVITTDYTYFGDGTPDLFNTEDDSTTQEDGVYGYDGSGLLVAADIDRGTQAFETDVTFTAGQFDRIDSLSLDGVGTVVNDSFYDFTYTVGDITLVEARDTPTNDLINSLQISYGTNGLPEDVDLISAPGPFGIDIFNSLTWTTWGALESVSSVASGGFGTGAASLTYVTAPGPAIRQLDNEVWTQAGAVGSLFSHYPGRNFRTSYTYDGGGLRTREEVDIDDNGSVEAILIFEWTPGLCNPSFQWAPNGPPNFAAGPGVPSVYVPGTGATYQENCGPFPVPEPSFAVSILAGGLVLRLLAHRQRRA